MKLFNETLLDFLEGQYQEQKLHHFMIFSTYDTMGEKKLNDFIASYFQRLNLVNFLDNNDILYLDKKEDKKAYHVDDLAGISTFTKHSPVKLKNKFLILNNANLLTDHALNKLLKTLEEPQINLVTIFLNNTAANLLPTIESRAVNFTINFEKNESQKWPSFESFLDFVQYTDSNKLSYTQIQSYILQENIQRFQNNKKTDVQSTLSSIQEDIEFNQSRQSILFKFYSLVSTF